MTKRLPLLLLVTSLLGCSHNLEVLNLTDYSRHAMDASQTGLTMTLELRNVSTEGDSFAQALAQALAAQGGYRVNYPARITDHADVSATLSLVATRAGNPGNIFVAWPGFIIFTHAWLGYRYDVSYDIRCELTAPATGERIGTVTVPIHLGMRHAEFDRTWANGCAWFFFYTLPALFNGVYCSSYDSDIDPLLRRDVFPTLAGHVATEIIRTVNALPWESADGLTY